MRMWCLLGLSLAAGCTAPASGSLGYMLLDRDTRAAGIEVAAGGWQGAPLLPLALGLHERVELVVHGGRVPVALRAGELAWVRGGAIEWRADVDPERLAVSGADQAVFDLADALGAEVAIDDGRMVLRAADLYHRASFLSVPDGVTEALPIGGARAHAAAGDDRAPANGDRALATAGVGVGDVAPATGTPELTELVGFYGTGDHWLLLDAAGGYSAGFGCDENARGTWRRDGDGLELSPAGGTPFAVLVQGATLHDPAGIDLVLRGEP
jgi:hypothetical protein